jgi:hypothetical protein
MILQRTLDTYCGMFDVRTSGGVVGAYDLQVPLPVNNTCVEFGVQVVRDAVGGAGVTISFDLIITGVSPKVTSFGYFFAPTLALPIAGFMPGPRGNIMGIAPVPNTLLANQAGGNSASQANGASVGFSIGTADLTDGAFAFWCRCVAFDF